MTRAELDAYLRSLPDAELISNMRTAAADLEHAAETQPQSEWHATCFAAAVCYAQEHGRRDLERRRMAGQALTHAPSR